MHSYIITILCCQQYLQFDLNTKVNLGELSAALEQEVRSVEDDNATYQAALASFLMEVRHLKSVLCFINSYTLDTLLE